VVIEPVASVLPNPVLSVAIAPPVAPVATNPVDSVVTNPVARKTSIPDSLSDIPDLFHKPDATKKAA
jgi:hypothetical protein